MSDEKEIVSKEETFDKLEIRLGRVVSVEEESTAPKKAYKMKVDFGTHFPRPRGEFSRI